MGGNCKAIIQEKTLIENEIGEKEDTYKDTNTEIIGYLDYMSGQANMNYNSKLLECDYVFICDYINFKFKENKQRLVIDDEIYDIKFVDNPMRLNEHLEIYLKRNDLYGVSR